jgi:hypothetical protein
LAADYVGSLAPSRREGVAVSADDEFGPVVELLDRSGVASPSDFAAIVADVARSWAARDVVVYLTDYERLHLVPVPSPDAADRADLSVEGSLAGRCFRTASPTSRQDPDGSAVRLWLPLVNGATRLGVLEVVLEASQDIAFAGWRHLARAVADLVVVRGLYGDIFEFVRRRRPMTLASQVQWQLAPPMAFDNGRIAVAGAFEPCYDVGGDAFDYAVNGDVLHVAVFDAMGHGLEAALCSTLAVSAYRNGRRELRRLGEIAAGVEGALLDRYGGERFVTAVLAELDVETGRLAWTNAGHDAPLLLRNGRLIKRLETASQLPYGLGLEGAVDTPELGQEVLEPGDQVLLFTDGVVEARRGQEFFTVERLATFVTRELASGHDAAEVLRRLTAAILRHQDNTLQDDATAVLLTWFGPRLRR